MNQKGLKGKIRFTTTAGNAGDHKVQSGAQLFFGGIPSNHRKTLALTDTNRFYSARH